MFTRNRSYDVGAALQAHPAIATASVLALTVMFGGLVMLLTAPVAQPLEYHQFADSRTLANMQNGLNVLSSLAFLVTGGLGFVVLQRRTSMARPIFSLYAVFFSGLVLTAIGSAYYHWSPSNESLVWDRVPMTLCFTALISIVFAERISTRFAYSLYPWLAALGVGSVIYWSIWDDLRLYLLVQFVPLVVVPLVLWRRPGSGAYWIWLALFFYLLAKVAEFYDSAVYAVSEDVMSGHTLKHLLASLGALMFVFKLQASVNLPQNG